MSISSENDRLTVIIPKALKAKLKVLAENESRSISNYVVKLLQEHVEENVHKFDVEGQMFLDFDK